MRTWVLKRVIPVVVQCVVFQWLIVGTLGLQTAAAFVTIASEIDNAQHIKEIQNHNYAAIPKNVGQLLIYVQEEEVSTLQTNTLSMWVCKDYCKKEKQMDR